LPAVARRLAVALSQVAGRLVVVLRLLVTRQASSADAKPDLAASHSAVTAGRFALLVALLVRPAGFVGLRT